MGRKASLTSADDFPKIKIDGIPTQEELQAELDAMSPEEKEEAKQIREYLEETRWTELKSSLSAEDIAELIAEAECEPPAILLPRRDREKLTRDRIARAKKFLKKHDGFAAAAEALKWAIANAQELEILPYAIGVLEMRLEKLAVSPKANRGRKWTHAEEERLITLHNDGKSHLEKANALGLTKDQVKGKIRALREAGRLPKGGS